MKKTNKILAVILCLCMMASFTALFASAEDATELDIYFGGGRATKFKEDDPETVLQLEIDIEAHSRDEEAAILDGIDTVDTNAVIPIREMVLTYAYLISTFGSIPNWIRMERLEQEIKEKSTIAIAKPVSYENGVLTLDVYSKDGTPGAKMIGVVFDGFFDDFIGYGFFQFDFPAGVLANSATGAYSSSTESLATFVGAIGIENLVIREIKLTKPVRSLIDAVLKSGRSDQSPGTLLGRMILILPILPLELMIFAARANSVYSVYGVNFNRIALDLCVELPVIIGVISALYIQILRTQ